MRFLGLEMARAEECTKSCMFNQMLVRDWDAHSVADTAKEKGELRKSTGVFYLVSLTDHITSCIVNHCKIHSNHRNEVDALPELLHKDQTNFILYWNCLFEKDRLLVYAESVYLVIFSLFQFHTFPNFSGRNQLKKSPCRRKSFGSGLIITNVPLRETYEGHVLYIVSEIWGTEEQLIWFEVFFFYLHWATGFSIKVPKRHVH